MSAVGRLVGTLVACVVLSGCAAAPVEEPPAPPLLSPDARRAFLRAYAPIVLKAADERKAKHRGQDWLTNFFFDGDRDLSNNKAHWSKELRSWLSGDPGVGGWSIRPTVYTALIEFRAGSGRKSLILLYHLYHAKQQGSIHDWERVELRLDEVAGGPGRGERVAYAVVTEHSIHRRVEGVRGGQRVWVWQAPWSKGGVGRKAELRALEGGVGGVGRMGAGDPARVDVVGLGSQPFHYVFVPPGVSFGGRPGVTISQERALGLIAAQGRPSIGQVRVLSYELQDLADILPTHLDERSWKDEVRIALETPLRRAEGEVAVPAGEVRFLYRARDVEDPEEKRKGYPWKHWFWGTYELGGRGWTREWIEEHEGKALPQHDYFAHDGEPGRSGAWLRHGEGWWRESRGGWDGRWEALFSDSR